MHHTMHQLSQTFSPCIGARHKPHLVGPAPTWSPCAAGIDLDDPLVLEELERLQRETPPELPPSSCRPVRHRSARPPPPDIHAIPLSEIKRRLDDLGVDRSSISDGDRAELEVLLLSQYSVARSSAGANVDLVNYQHSSLCEESDEIEESDALSRGGGLRAALGEFCIIF
eukprot:scaffold125840_cov32-Tisochrysis_lutea.AAC.1